MKDGLARWILRHRLLVAVLLALVTAPAAWFAVKVTFDNTIEIWFLKGDQGLAGYHRFLDLFESDEIVVVAMAPGDVFTSGSLEILRRITDRLGTLDHVIRVTSLTNVEIPRAVPGGVEIGPLMDGIPSDPVELARIRSMALASKLLVGTLVSGRGDAAAVIARIEHIPGRFDYKVKLLRQVRAIMAGEGGDQAMYMAGAPVIDDAFFHYTERDFVTFIPLCLLLIVLVILVLFRRPQAVVLPLAVVVLSLVWTFGLMGLAGLKINVVSTILAPLLMAVGIADSIHILSQYYEDLEEGMHKEDAIVTAFRNVLVPCMLTSLTTAAGLLSLLASELAPIREFGAVAAAGVLFAFLITILAIPVALSVLKPPPARFLESHRTGALSRMLDGLARFGVRRARAIGVFSLAAVLAAGYSLTHLVVGTNSLDYFRDNDPVRRATDFIDTRIGGTVSVEFLLEGRRAGTFKEPSALAAMDRLESFLDKMPGVTGSLSLADFLKEMNRVMHGGGAAYYRLPDSRRLAAQYLLLMEGSPDLEEMVQDDYRIARISTRVRMEDSLALSRKVGEIERYLRSHFTGGIKAQATGLVKLMHDMESYLLASQIRSFSLAFVVILVMIASMLGSLRLGLFAMIPNLLPVLLTLGLMALAGIHLDVGTVTIASILLGLVVDDTIHFLHRFRLEARSGADPAAAIHATIRWVGRPIFSTSVILALGFWVLCLASFKPDIHFGLLSGVAILMALVADLVVLPAAIILLRPRFGR